VVVPVLPLLLLLGALLVVVLLLPLLLGMLLLVMLRLLLVTLGSVVASADPAVGHAAVAVSEHAAVRVGLSCPPCLLFGVVLLVAVLFVLGIGRYSDSENQGQDGRAGDCDHFHVCCLRCC
jgi:hypothetical protein